MRVAYQGERGAFSETAARRLMGAEMTGIPCPSFEEMFESVRRGDADCCIAPIENSLAGSIHRNYDLLLDSNFSIAGETHLRIVHHLIAPPDVSIDRIRRVYSHPVALAQCNRFLGANPQMEPTPVHDTAGAVRLVMDRRRDDEAGIASADAAEIYGGRIVAEGIEDHEQNFTRFLLLAPPDAPSRSSLATRSGAGRLPSSSAPPIVPTRSSTLSARSPRSISIWRRLSHDRSKESPGSIRSTSTSSAAATNPTSPGALDNLASMSEMVRVLGSYPTRW